MSVDTLTPLSALIQDLGWTLLHFFWQGALGAGTFLVVMRILKRRSPTTRYLTGLLVFAATAILPVITFFLLYSDSTQGIPTPAAVASTLSFSDIALTTEFWQQVLPDIVALLPWVVTAWLCGVLLLSTRLVFDWQHTQRLRTTKSEKLPDRYQHLIERLCHRLGLENPVQTRVSSAVDCPTTIGWLRPLILIPTSSLLGLTPEQLEMVITHEIAHIRRHDYLVNLFQVIIEILFFYHPAMRWMSEQIRFEREHCCDDFVVVSCNNPAAYARALAELETARSNSDRLALAANGGLLIERI